MLETNNLSKIFKSGDGIKDVNLKIKDGSFHALIGPNGAGKTTLIKTILRLYQDYVGEVKINNIPTTDVRAFDKISYIGENAIFPNEFSAERFLIWAGKMNDLTVSQTKILIKKYSKGLGVNANLKRNPNKFSSGQKQKIMLMKVLIESSNFIIMDEPTANLDPSARIVFFDEIKKLNEQGKTIFICSHNLEEIEEKIDWVSVLKKGEIVYSAAKGEKRLIEIFKEKAHE